MRREEYMATKENNTPKLIFAWLFVGIPLTWGVVETGINALKLFQ
jgi:hypothetical protein